LAQFLLEAVISFRTTSGIGIATNSRSFCVELSSAISLKITPKEPTTLYFWWLS